jgi:hypothetical protein
MATSPPRISTLFDMIDHSITPVFPTSFQGDDLLRPRPSTRLPVGRKAPGRFVHPVVVESRAARIHCRRGKTSPAMGRRQSTSLAAVVSEGYGTGEIEWRDWWQYDRRRSRTRTRLLARTVGSWEDRIRKPQRTALLLLGFSGRRLVSPGGYDGLLNVELRGSLRTDQPPRYSKIPSHPPSPLPRDQGGRSVSA